MEPAISAPRIFAVIPAAGASRRMQAPKLLLDLGGQPLIARCIAALNTAGLAEVLVVIRPGDAELRRAVENAGARALEPAAPPPEMRNSIECGLQWIDEHRAPTSDDAWLVSPADHPLLDPRWARRLTDEWRRRPAGILIPTCEGRRGHPIILAWSFAAKLRELAPDQGLNTLIRQFSTEVVEFETRASEILLDVDTPEDLARARALWVTR